MSSYHALGPYPHIYIPNHRTSCLVSSYRYQQCGLDSGLLGWGGVLVLRAGATRGEVRLSPSIPLETRVRTCARPLALTRPLRGTVRQGLGRGTRARTRIRADKDTHSDEDTHSDKDADRTEGLEARAGFFARFRPSPLTIRASRARARASFAPLRRVARGMEARRDGCTGAVPNTDA